MSKLKLIPKWEKKLEFPKIIRKWMPEGMERIFKK
jgi:hypothetical protein